MNWICDGYFYYRETKFTQKNKTATQKSVSFEFLSRLWALHRQGRFYRKVECTLLRRDFSIIGSKNIGKLTQLCIGILQTDHENHQKALHFQNLLFFCKYRFRATFIRTDVIQRKINLNLKLKR